jgi:hypothetical protein
MPDRVVVVVVVAVVLAAIGAWLFVAPHRRDDVVAEKRTLANAAWALLRLKDARGGIRRWLLRSALIYGCVVVFVPAIAAGVLCVASADDARWIAGVSAIALAVGAPLNWFMLWIAQANFAFGGVPRRDATWVGRVTPVYVAICAIASVAIAARGG